MPRPRHPHKDLEPILDAAENKGWHVQRRRKYYMMRCPCGQHQKTVKITPSDPNYPRNLRGWLKRSGCWEDR